jgi:hypothetical protein
MTSVDFVNFGSGTLSSLTHSSSESFSSYALNTWALISSSVCPANLALAIAEALQHFPCQQIFLLQRKRAHIYPNSLNRHVIGMREDDALDGLPHFSLHLPGATTTNFVEKKVGPVHASLELAYALPGSAEEMSSTTREYYTASQRMEEKALAMRA